VPASRAHVAARAGEARPVAGGESLMPLLAFRLAAPAVLADLRNIAGLDRALIGDEGVTLAARVR
jgi:carbon-monoxide dehydrogenase medium subunit